MNDWEYLLSTSAPLDNGPTRVTKPAFKKKTSLPKHIYTPEYMLPVEEKIKRWKDFHATKKDGSCRKDCRVCKDIDFDRKATEDPNATFHDLHKARDKLYHARQQNREPSPSYDHAGYELDYDKVESWFAPTSVRSLKPTMSKMEKFDKQRDQEHSEEWEMIKAFFEDGAAPEGEGETYGIKNYTPVHTVDAIRTRVERDIGVPFHKVGLEEVQKWVEAGNPRAKKGGYVKFTTAETNEFSEKLQGAGLRK